MRKYLFLTICVFSLAISFACVGARSKTIPKDMSKWDTELKPYIERLSDDEKALLTKYLMQQKLGEVFGGGGIPDGFTIGQAIDKQKQLDAEQSQKELEAKLLKEKIEREKAELSKKVSDTLTVAYIGKTFVPSDIYSGRVQDVVMVELAFENKGTKGISGFKGKLEFSDMFGDKVKSVNLSYDENLPAGKTKNWKGTLRYNPFIGEDKKFRDVEKDKVKFAFVPEMVVFDDGSKLVIPTK